MAQQRLKAAFYRGGTSKSVVFDGRDLPQDRAERDRIFLHVLGSPDPYGRQLDGLGGGLSSLSKVVIVEPSTHAEADVDYTFVQIAVDAPVADYGAMCGNMSSAVGPFAVDEGMVTATGTEATVRVRNTNTNKFFHARFPVKDGKAVESGSFEIPGVATSGAKVALEFLAPGGASTGMLLPTGQPRDHLDVAGFGRFEVSLIDASNPMVFLRAKDLGCDGSETPEALDRNTDVMAALDAIRRAGGVAMGMAETPDSVKLSNPRVALIAPPAPFQALDGRTYAAEDHDIAVRLVSMGNVHRAVTLTGAMCIAVAAEIPGSLVADMTQSAARPIRLGNPSGVLPVTAEVTRNGDGLRAVSATSYRTQRRIMEGHVLYPKDL
ncbi:PrpF domain-containing protein [Cognatishimia sp. SS12]|uniref:2-methylaconitate cis-trans isomerase PrpF family protein n=1 Tax=Cognatishimia sp. SS12 TaxID=2979465 RepID=UPI00232FF74C|nr:PrpF domain-containing protein [Cognatishimia sp. SS12]MDC0739522.1 PrpF domain-containing protein [Cognatishimia sp. SS12]